MNRNTPSAVGQRNKRGRELQGSGGLVGIWEMEKEGAKTRATNAANMDMHEVPLTSCFSSSPAGHNPTHFGRTTIANIPTQYVTPAS